MNTENIKYNKIFNFAIENNDKQLMELSAKKISLESKVLEYLKDGYHKYLKFLLDNNIINSEYIIEVALKTNEYNNYKDLIPYTKLIDKEILIKIINKHSSLLERKSILQTFNIIEKNINYKVLDNVNINDIKNSIKFRKKYVGKVGFTNKNKNKNINDEYLLKIIEMKNNSCSFAKNQQPIISALKYGQVRLVNEYLKEGHCDPQELIKYINEFINSENAVNMLYILKQAIDLGYKTNKTNKTNKELIKDIIGQHKENEISNLKTMSEYIESIYKLNNSDKEYLSKLIKDLDIKEQEKLLKKYSNNGSIVKFIKRTINSEMIEFLENNIGKNKNDCILKELETFIILVKKLTVLEKLNIQWYFTNYSDDYSKIFIENFNFIFKRYLL